ncbi:hypothetical protein FOXB_01558, partial [Fusarium oxysporum f. sp. conglutinans Fo5176]
KSIYINPKGKNEKLKLKVRRNLSL